MVIKFCWWRAVYGEYENYITLKITEIFNICRYDVMTQRDATDILELYKSKLQKIPNGVIHGICVDYLPTYIISDNDQVLRLRRKMKCLQIPEFTPLSKEDKFSKILLYFPLRRGQVIDSDRLGNHFIMVLHNF